MSLQDYGEDALAQRVPSLSDSEMSRIQEIAKRHKAALGVPIRPRGPSIGLTRKVEKAESLAAVAVMEGAIRSLKRKRRLGAKLFDND
jgi:DUF1365 family protein